MLEQEQHSRQSDSGNEADHPRQPAIRFSSLYERLSKVETESAEHKRIQEEIAAVKESMAAREQWVQRLVNAIECEQAYALVSSMRLLEKRLNAQVSELREADLTWTELARLNRFINEQTQAVKRRLENWREDKKQAGKCPE